MFLPFTRHSSHFPACASRITVHASRLQGTPLTLFFKIPLYFTEEVFEQGMIGSNPFDILNRFPSTGVTILKGLIVLLLSQEWEDGF